MEESLRCQLIMVSMPVGRAPVVFCTSSVCANIKPCCTPRPMENSGSCLAVLSTAAVGSVWAIACGVAHAAVIIIQSQSRTGTCLATYRLHLQVLKQILRIKNAIGTMNIVRRPGKEVMADKNRSRKLPNSILTEVATKFVLKQAGIFFCRIFMFIF